jgi:enoyl-CoA hydratase/carnithine racemase
MKKATYFLLSGDVVSAAEAEAMGLITRAVADDELSAASWEIASKLAKLPPSGLAIAKRQIQLTYEAAGLRSALQHATELATLSAVAEDPEKAEFYAIAAQDGYKEAFKWRDRRFDGEST